MYNKDKYIKLIKDRLSSYRFHHSVCVAERARDLALKYGADPQKAYIAGILHDIMKETSSDIQIAAAEKAGISMTRLERNNPKVHHQISGAAYIRTELGIDDSDILSGVRYHTTGHANMTLFEMIIYLADFTSADREYPDVDVMREKTDSDMLSAMLYSLSYTIRDIASQNRQIHPDTLECYNWVIEQINNRGVK